MGIENFQQYGATTIKHVSFLPDGTVLGSYGDKRKQRHAKKQKLNNNNNNNSNNNGNMEKQQASSASDDVSHTIIGEVQIIMPPLRKLVTHVYIIPTKGFKFLWKKSWQGIPF